MTWLYSADMIGGLLSFLLNYKNIVWNVRNSNLESFISFKGYLGLKICKLLSYKVPKSIIYNSQKGLMEHNQFGYNYDNSVVIQNGYPLCFTNDEFKLYNNNTLQIGHLARYHPVKNHLLFLKSIQKLININCDVHVHMGGTNVDINNQELVQHINKLNLNNHITLHGAVSNVSKFYNTIDLFVLSSKSEGFPNVLAESILSKCIALSTNVGDAPYILGHNNYLLENNVEKIVCKLLFFYDLYKNQKNIFLSHQEFQFNHVKKHFLISNMIHKYNLLLSKTTLI